ncbi:MAG: DUF4981 domain-containing protein [Prevotellaceae bacterium]|nr:DUF4981 domain-containing protein [Prevotellaceae bacterium]
MKKNSIFLLLLSLVGGIASAQETKAITLSNAGAQETEKMMLSGNSPDDNVMWDFYCTAGRNSGTESRIRVPSCWELEGFGEYNYGHDKNKHAEIGIYRTNFILPEKWKNKRIFIVFEGSMTDTKVKVNGKQAGNVHQGAFYCFKREITDLVTDKKENRLEVEVSKMSANASVNSAERDADFWVFGGIFRPVYLEAVPKTFIEYSGIDAGHDGKIHIELVMNEPVANVKVNVEIFEIKTGNKVAGFLSESHPETKKLTVTSVISGIKPWNVETPSLYNAVITVSRNGNVLHTITERFGFRTIEVRERDGIYLNNKKIMFKGVNRHSFWPATGRAMSTEQNLQDVMLIKEMNMNAVRMSHYPPDKCFLELCDSVGLYVINELCAWQWPPYDTQTGTILVNEMLKRDLNHPSIIFWANGNEGGFNYDLDSLFHQIDTQKRPVIHPFGLHGKINTVHYITYNSGIKNMFNGRDIFMPTELIHGLYDGGHGAGLDDFWNLMRSNPLSAGLFLWDFADQGVVRTDQGGILDTDKDHGADGILGPYREKEGSFYAIKEIWSPIFLEKKYITPQWNGTFNIENRYDFTNTNRCRFSWSLSRFNFPNGDKEEIKGNIDAPDIEPGGKGTLRLILPAGWKQFDVLYLTAYDHNGYELFTWSYELNEPAFFAERIIKQNQKKTATVNIREDSSCYILSAAGVTAKINKTTGMLEKVTNKQGIIPLTNGPVFVTDRNVECGKVASSTSEGEAPAVTAIYNFRKERREACRFTWTMQKNGVLQLDYEYRPLDNIEMAGITFDFPEKEIEGARLFANGPYRVYKNRLKGVTLNIWEKEYNDAITGEVWNYPEFKGYYSLFYGMRLLCPTPFEVYSASEDLFLHLFTPSVQKQYAPERNYTFPKYPSGNISFMDAIPAVGTKFGKAENFGPQSQRYRYKEFSGSPNIKNRLYFKFN